MKCPKCGNEKIATAKQPNLTTYHYCALCDYEWKEITRLTRDKMIKNYGKVASDHISQSSFTGK